jgi:hypothetical protein
MDIKGNNEEFDRINRSYLLVDASTLEYRKIDQ